MITKEDLLDGIAKCQGVRNPNANTCQKLAALLTIYHYMYDEEQNNDNKPLESQNYSYDSENVENIEINVDYFSESDFSKAVDGKNAIKAW